MSKFISLDKCLYILLIILSILMPFREFLSLYVGDIIKLIPDILTLLLLMYYIIKSKFKIQKIGSKILLKDQANKGKVKMNKKGAGKKRKKHSKHKMRNKIERNFNKKDSKDINTFKRLINNT